MKISLTLAVRLERLARRAAKSSYSPYSRFAVGAAVLAGSGKVYSGANIENSSFGLCNCAERTAIFTAVAAGEKKIKCVVVYTPTTSVTPPCGACRQVINEFGPQARVVSICDSDDRIDTTLDALLPGAFGPGNLS
jgi:cytidine deaminase